MRHLDDIIIDAQTVANDTINSEAIDISSIVGFSAQIQSSGSTIDGVAKVQASLDNSTWIDISGASVNLTGSGDNDLINVSDAFYKYFRVQVISNDANTITVTVRVFGKGV